MCTRMHYTHKYDVLAVFEIRRKLSAARRKGSITPDAPDDTAV